MADKDKSSDKNAKILATIEAFQDFADKLTVRRILIAVLAGILGLALFTAVEHRNALFHMVLDTKTSQGVEVWTMTPETEAELVALVKKPQGIVKLALVTHVDLRKNRRTPIFWYLDDPQVSKIKQKVASMLPTAVFDDDQKNTEQLVATLNNQFVCSKFEDTVYQRHFPELQANMPYICRLAVPPFYGRFVGLLTFGLRSEPTKLQLDALKLEAARLSTQIYLRDVLHTTK